MGEWIEHDGKAMPVDGDTYVQVRFRDGSEDRVFDPLCDDDKASYWNDNNPSANCWLWGVMTDSGSEIVAYRVVA